MMKFTGLKKHSTASSLVRMRKSGQIWVSENVIERELRLNFPSILSYDIYLDEKEKEMGFLFRADRNGKTVSRETRGVAIAIKILFRELKLNAPLQSLSLDHSVRSEEGIGMLLIIDYSKF